jgi:hypothetical protein
MRTHWALTTGRSGNGTPGNTCNSTRISINGFQCTDFNARISISMHTRTHKAHTHTCIHAYLFFLATALTAFNKWTQHEDKKYKCRSTHTHMYTRITPRNTFHSGYCNADAFTYVIVRMQIINRPIYMCVCMQTHTNIHVLVHMYILTRPTYMCVCMYTGCIYSHAYTHQAVP